MTTTSALTPFDPDAWNTPYIPHTITSDAMEPKFRLDDIVFFDSTIDRWIADGIYLVRMGDSERVCRIQRMIHGSYRVFYDHPEFQDITLSAQDMKHLTILGMARAHLAQL